MGKIKSRFETAGVIPVLVFDDAQFAIDTAGALLEGRLDVLEVTLRTKDSWAALEKIIEQYPKALTGVGTVINAD